VDGITELARMFGKQPDKAQKTATATVSRIADDGTIYASIPGGAGEFPVSRTTVDVSAGDTVNVRIENGRASIDGSTSAPSISAARATELMVPIADAAQKASDGAAIAQQRAQEATESAATASIAANQANTLLSGMQAAATAAGTTLTGIYQDAEDANTAATQAKTAANAATFSLSDVEKVVGTLNWISEHGEYVNQAGQTFDATKTYYTRSGTSPNYVYTVVANPVAADIASYYVLNIDESVQNYLAAHLWEDNYGLNISVDSANGYRIHQGTVDGTHAAGMYILDGNGYIVQTLNASGSIIGKETDAHISIMPTKVAVNGGSQEYLSLGPQTWTSGGPTGGGVIRFSNKHDCSISGSMDGSISILSSKDKITYLYAVADSSGFSVGDYFQGSLQIRFPAIPSYGRTALLAASSKKITSSGAAESTVFKVSYDGTINTVGNIEQGNGTKANSANQVAFGKYNVADNSSTYAVIVGNGTADNARSNAFAVGWDGHIDCAGPVISGPATHEFLAGRFTYGRLSGR